MKEWEELVQGRIELVQFSLDLWPRDPDAVQQALLASLFLSIRTSGLKETWTTLATPLKDQARSPLLLLLLATPLVCSALSTSCPHEAELSLPRSLVLLSSTGSNPCGMKRSRDYGPTQWGS